MLPYDVLSPHAQGFINHGEIMESLAWAQAQKNNRDLIRQTMQKAGEKKGLGHREAALLLAGAESGELFELAGKIKREFYGSRVVLFAPLHLSNHCVNGCVYCPYHAGNSAMPRKKLKQEIGRAHV